MDNREKPLMNWPTALWLLAVVFVIIMSWYFAYGTNIPWYG